MIGVEKTRSICSDVARYKEKYRQIYKSTRCYYGFSHTILKFSDTYLALRWVNCLSVSTMGDLL